MNKLKDEEKEFKKFIGESYVSQMTAQRQKEIEERQRNLEEEKKRLDMLQKQIEEERRQKAQQRQAFKKEVDELLQKKKEQRDFEKELQNLNQEEQRKLMEERARQEQDREQHYKQHFEDYNKIMQERIKMHMATVGNSESAKNAQYRSWVMKHETEYQEKLKEKERELDQWRKMVLSFSHAIVLTVLEFEQHLQGGQGTTRPEGDGEG